MKFYLILSLDLIIVHLFLKAYFSFIGLFKWGLSKKVKLFCLFFCLFFSLPVLAKQKLKSGKAAGAIEAPFEEQQSYSTKELSAIVVKAVHLRLRVENRSNTPLNLKWKGSGKVENKDGVLTVEAENYSKKVISPSEKEKPFVMDISSGSALPLELFARTVEISVSGWSHPVFVSAFKGSLNALGNKGPWQISLREGEINLRRHKGRLALKGSQLKVLMSECQGNFKLRVNGGALKFKKLQGDLDFITNRASVRLLKFKGSLRGKSQSGLIQGSIQPEQVELFSSQGDIRLSFIKQAGKVTAYTKRGKIYGARHLSREFSGKSTKIVGWFKARHKKGFISLSSDTGNIYLN